MKEIERANNSFPVRYVIVDNSGSMNMPDGRRLVAASDGAIHPVSATRWAELGDTVSELAKVTSALNAETHFHLLNPSAEGQFFVLNIQDTAITARAGAPCDIDKLRRVMQTACEYSTPLTEAVQLVADCVKPSEATLRAAGKRAVVIIATDGLPNDAKSFLNAMTILQRLPVWVIVRLCTNDESVVSYWSDLDKQLEMPLEVLDDVEGEAREAHLCNPWLVCPPALHLARTIGIKDKLYDLIDEQPLAPSQVKQLIERLLGGRSEGFEGGEGGESGLAEPELEPELFLRQVRQLVASSPSVYNPVTKRMGPWIDMRALERFLARRRHKGSSGDLCMGAADEIRKATSNFCTIS